MPETIKDKLQNEKRKMQEKVYKAIVDFEIETGCEVTSADIQKEGDGRGNTKTVYIDFNIRL
jgi:hypothetical protein